MVRESRAIVVGSAGAGMALGCCRGESNRGAVVRGAEVAGMAADADAVVGGAAVDCPDIVEAADTRLSGPDLRRL